MKYLIIDNGQGFFCFENDTSKRKPIDQITKEDLLKLVNLSLAETFEMDPFDDMRMPARWCRHSAGHGALIPASW